MGMILWLDGNDTLASVSTATVNLILVKVAEMVDVNGDWDWRRIAQWLPQDIPEKLAAVKPPCSGVGPDIRGWRWEKNRDISVRSAYKVLHTHANAENIPQWSKFWKLPVPQRIRVFMWLAFHQRLMTNAERVWRHLAMSDACPLCNGASETIEHVLRSCPRARRGWGPLKNDVEGENVGEANRRRRQRQLASRAATQEHVIFSRKFGDIALLLKVEVGEPGYMVLLHMEVEGSDIIYSRDRNEVDAYVLKKNKSHRTECL
ncbi:hypothetical protein GQ457_06G016690 [Hibiscus cannabinus]